MSLNAAVWTVVVVALILANAPFAFNRPLAPWPWREPQGGAGAWRSWAWLVLYLVGLAAWAWGTLIAVGGAFAAGLVPALVISVAVAVAWLSWPGWLRARQRASAPAATDARGQAAARALARNPALAKPFIDRLLELVVGYGLVGTLGYALEVHRGNPFAQTWEFYAISLALFLVLGYPGFVLRYMLKHGYRGI